MGFCFSAKTLDASQDFLIYLCPGQCVLPTPTEFNLYCITKKLGRRNFLKIDSYELTVNHKSIVLVKLPLKIEFGYIWYGGKATEPRQEGISRVWTSSQEGPCTGNLQTIVLCVASIVKISAELCSSLSSVEKEQSGKRLGPAGAQYRKWLILTLRALARNWVQLWCSPTQYDCLKPFISVTKASWIPTERVVVGTWQREYSGAGFRKIVFCSWTTQNQR